jgi:hypothetical protein
MPALTGVFNLFSQLDTITAADIAAFGGTQIEHHSFENHLANRILFPQTIASSKQELDLDFLILALAVQKQPEVFYDASQNRIIIPQQAVFFFPPLTRLISVILLSIPDKKVTELWLKEGNNQQIIGSSIPASFIEELNIPGEIKIFIEGEMKTLIPNQLNLIPTTQEQVKIQFDQTRSITTVGGSLGIFVDLRRGKV